MTRDPRYDVLFEPVPIGPLTARNRFYQVPHCTGMGFAHPSALAALRGIKAEGGWAVVCTEYCSIHPTSDDCGYPHARLWDRHDIRSNAAMTDAVHAHGSLAGVELWIGGSSISNLYSRLPTLGVSSRPTQGRIYPSQSRRADRRDLRDLRRWHADAARRAREAGFDIVYVYATHDYLLSEFLSPVTNTRTDEYGGSLANRVRLVRELIEETREAAGPDCAVAVRFSADGGSEAETEERPEMFSLLAELPDLWDINIADYSVEMGSSRFVESNALEQHMGWVKAATSKPVVSVGRHTSPDAMASLVRRGVVDFIGAARPSIADPFLPRKIEEGRVEDIRECIGCNLCYATDTLGAPIRCTQNPTLGEEWRSGWHPETVPPAARDESVLIVGAGPAGLEAARVLGERGYDVTLAEAGSELGGRVAREARLPGLAQWARVRDYRVTQLQRLSNVAIYRDSELDAQQILEFGFPRVAIATGARWRGDGIGRFHQRPIPLAGGVAVFTPDDLLAGRMPVGRVLVYDDEHYYMGGCLAQRLADSGAEVHLVTPEGVVSAWCQHTGEQPAIQAGLLRSGVTLHVSAALTSFDAATAELACVYTGDRTPLQVDAVVLVTARKPEDRLYRALADDGARVHGAGITHVAPIGDCDAPGTIAAAVHAGYRFAWELDRTADIAVRFESPPAERRDLYEATS